jgi:hypothetical protein
MSLNQTQHKDNSRVAVDSVSRAARVVAAKRKTSSKAAKRAAKLSLASRLAGNLHQNRFTRRPAGGRSLRAEPQRDNRTSIRILPILAKR